MPCRRITDAIGVSASAALRCDVWMLASQLAKSYPEPFDFNERQKVGPGLFILQWLQSAGFPREPRSILGTRRRAEFKRACSAWKMLRASFRRALYSQHGLSKTWQLVTVLTIFSIMIIMMRITCF